MTRVRWHQRYFQPPSPCTSIVSTFDILAVFGSRSNIPHAGQQLHQTAISKCNAHDKIRRCQTSRAHIDQAQHECGQGESGQTERSGIGETPVLDLLIETRLKLSSKSGETLSTTGGGDMGERTVTEASGGFGSLMFFMRHFSMGTGTVELFVVVLRRIAGMLGVGHGRHGEG